MPVTAEKWKLYAGIGLVLWAAGLQVGIRFVAGFLSCKLSPHCKAKLVWRQCHRPEHQSDCLCLSLQYSMWELQKRPEYKQKIEKPALERDLQDDMDPKQKMQWSVRTKF